MRNNAARNLHQSWRVRKPELAPRNCSQSLADRRFLQVAHGAKLSKIGIAHRPRAALAIWTKTPPIVLKETLHELAAPKNHSVGKIADPASHRFPLLQAALFLENFLDPLLSDPKAHRFSILGEPARFSPPKELQTIFGHHPARDRSMAIA